MSFFSKPSLPARQAVTQTGFYVSVVFYSLLLVCESVRPGFVARYFSPHLVLLACVLFGVWWVSVLEDFKDRRIVQYAVSVVVGALLAVLTWNLGAGFAEYRLLVALISLFVPLAFLRLVRLAEK